MRTVLADYEQQRQAFEGLLAPDCARRILIFQGQSGSGKTTLLRACIERLPGDVFYVPIQFRDVAVGVHEIFSRAGHVLGWERLLNFTAQVRDLPGTQINIQNNKMYGVEHSINVTLKQADSPAERKDRLASLTNAWFQDVQAFERPLLLAMDTFEQATNEVAQWIAGPFLARAPYAPALRVLLAGQTVPDAHNIEWGTCCQHFELYGVPEAAHWLPVVEALGRFVPAPDPLSWLAGVCHILEGDPRSIMEVIQTLPLQEGTA